jgi:hypothetical protein
MTYCAVARYVVGSSAIEKRRDLLEGLERVIYELAELELSRDDIEREVESALDAIEYDRVWNGGD